jgi:hypothetical protein
VPVAPGAEARVEAAAAKFHTPTPTSDNENSPLPTQPESQTRRALKLASQIQIYATNELVHITHQPQSGSSFNVSDNSNIRSFLRCFKVLWGIYVRFTFSLASMRF